MKLAVWVVFIALLIAFASAAVIPEGEYLPPVAEEEQIAAEQPLEESAALAKDGYRYKTVRKLRHRRDVSHLFDQGTLADDGYHYHAPSPTEALPKTSMEYLPPVEEATENKEVSEVPQLSNAYLPPTTEEAKETTKAPEISREYLPPTEAAATLDIPKYAASEELPTLDDDAVIIEGPEESSALADDGYHYRRIRYRRNLPEIASSTSGYSYKAPTDAYIPPAEVKEAPADDEIIKEYLPPSVEEIMKASETAELADDGYRYKTIRKLKYRQRRDVSEVVSSSSEVPVEEISSEASLEYLPPVAEVKEAAEIPSETAELAEDGYRYKTVRKLKYRQRRDVSEIVAPKSAILAEDGYHYRIPEPTFNIARVSNEYLPPTEDFRELSEEPKEVQPTTETSVVTESAPVVTESTTVVTESVPVITESTPAVTEAISTISIRTVSNEYLPPSEEVPEVKTVTEIPSTTTVKPVSNEYLPPVSEIPDFKEASNIPEETAILADDGYHYKVGKRFRFRRDVSEIVNPSNGYAYEAPAATNDVANIYLPPVQVNEAPTSTEIPQVTNEYLPPTAEATKDDIEIIDAPEESAVLADDGYHYKTVRRLKYRNRRDVSELVAPVEESAILSTDGYHYKQPSADLKTSSEYLPPVENVAEVKESLNIEPTIAPEVSEVSNEYLPPSEVVAPKEASTPEVSNEYLPPTEQTRGSAEIVEIQPQESAVLADDGYHYKTVRRVRYRHRRDVSEIVAPQANDGYVYDAPVAVEAPVEEVAQVKEAADTAELADDGYRYKTVRRIRYRHRV